MEKTSWPNKVLIASKKESPQGVCQISGEKFTLENSPDGVNGYEIRVIHPDILNKTIAIEVCKKVYLEFYKDMYPQAETPKI